MEHPYVHNNCYLTSTRKLQVRNFNILGVCLMVCELPVEGASEVCVEDAVHDGIEGAVEKEEKQHHCVGERRDLLAHLDRVLLKFSL